MLTVPTRSLELFHTTKVRLASLARMSLDIGAQGIKSPVRVMPLDDGRLVVMDGVHRVLAARICGRDLVPIETIETTEFLTSNMEISHLSDVISRLDSQLDKYIEVMNRLNGSRTLEIPSKCDPDSIEDDGEGTEV